MIRTIANGSSIFECGAQVLVNATNTEGIMGGGLALEFKKRYPRMFKSYALACKNGSHTVLRPHFWWNEHQWQYGSANPWRYDYNEAHVLNIATKDIIAHDSTVTNIACGLAWLAENYKLLKIKSIAVPALGCGLGKVKWEDAVLVMYPFLQLLEGVEVKVFEPQ